jgi:hypothetical protein
MTGMDGDIKLKRRRRRKKFKMLCKLFDNSHKLPWLFSNLSCLCGVCKRKIKMRMKSPCMMSSMKKRLTG